MAERVGKWARRVTVTVAVFVPCLAAFLVLSIQISSQPRFCGSCHYMAPYYASWQTSSHKAVVCVECHIPPGITSEFRKKYEALAMVARYFTGTYSTNPWAEVDDESCLRSGCHAKRVLLSQELYRGVLFDHQPHLTEMRRGKQLRCTSCHSQIVQGSHISVTASTCFLCHFKDTPLNEGTGRCTLCHQIPEKRITTVGLSFDHGEVKRLSMQCNSCHQGVVKGDGEVPRERCYTCHNDPPRLSRYGETEFLHQTHVTEHKVECLNCHVEVAHRIPVREEALAADCRSCHSTAAGHSAVRDLYRGIGGKGVEPRPASMYLAGIRCEACHGVSRSDLGRADEVSCMSCHSPKYLTIYRNWQVGLAKRLEGVRAELDEVKKRAAASADGAARELLTQVEENVALVERGRGIHNPGYAVDLLERAHRDNAAALKALGETGLPATPWVEAPYATECLRCHFGIEYLSRPAFGREFSHRVHVVSAQLRCRICHRDMPEHGALKIGAGDCDRCHARIAAPIAVSSSAECLECHTAELGRRQEKVKFPHQNHIAAGLDCELCHSGITGKSHRDLARSANAVPAFAHEFCAVCHAADTPAADGIPDQADCTKCHVAF